MSRRGDAKPLTQSLHAVQRNFTLSNQVFRIVKCPIRPRRLLGRLLLFGRCLTLLVILKGSLIACLAQIRIAITDRSIAAKAQLTADTAAMGSDFTSDVWASDPVRACEVTSASGTKADRGSNHF